MFFSNRVHITIATFVILQMHNATAKWSLQDISNFGSNDDEAAPHYDESSKTLHIPRFNAKAFRGHSLNFRGADIANAHLVNTTFDGYIPHLAINTLEVRSEIANAADGMRMATFDPRGSLSTASSVRWDDGRQTLHVQNLASHSSSQAMTFYSNVDLNSNTLSNFKLEKDAPFENVKIDASIITDTKLVNASFDDLVIGSVNIDELHLSSLSKPGSFPIVGEGGNLVAGEALFEFTDSLAIQKKLRLNNAVDFNGNEIDNVQLKSGVINGEEFDLDVRDINTKTLTLDTYKNAKGYLRDTFVILKEDGSIASSNITFEDGWIGNMKVFGVADFRGKNQEVGDDGSRTPGKIVGAAIEAGTIKRIEELSVSGPANLEQNLDVRGDAFVDGGLTVGGSVLGSGPYVDVSDKRLKRNIKSIRTSFDNVIENLSKLHAVEYELKSGGTNKKGKREIGFVAQEVQEIFPDLVSTRPDGFLGLQYSRFVPILVEAVKDLQEQIHDLERNA